MVVAFPEVKRSFGMALLVPNITLLAWLALTAVACVDSAADSDAFDAGGGSTDIDEDSSSDAGAGTEEQPPVRPAGQDILTTDLLLDMTTRRGQAEIVANPDPETGQFLLQTGRLELHTLRVNGAQQPLPSTDGLLWIQAENAATEIVVEVDYTFPARSLFTFDGWMPDVDITFIWPFYCANLFPCSTDLTDGVTFSLEVIGVPDGLTAIYPASTVSDAPSYMPAVAIGDYVHIDLGVTRSGTQISVWNDLTLVSEEDALSGTAHMRDVFEFFEDTYGPYAFGTHAGAVAVDWGADSYGGSEFHPFFHVAKFDFYDEEVHAHEVAHGWFGNAVRMKCWEDFVLSEGTVTYMAARGLDAVGGPDVWPLYLAYLDDTCAGIDTNAIVMPSTCNEIDFVNHELWSLATYMKGACFYEDVADLIGKVELDGILRDFYSRYRNQSARMQDMLDAIESRVSRTQWSVIEGYIADWLLSYDCPIDYRQRCGTHAP